MMSSNGKPKFVGISIWFFVGTGIVSTKDYNFSNILIHGLCDFATWFLTKTLC